jgi:L-rhamnose mutarotase
MERHGFAMEIKKGQTAVFRSALGGIWKELTAFLDEKKMVNFSIWSVGNLVFGYYETEDGFAFTDSDKEKAAKWFNDSFNWISTPFEEMRLMYHDFGIVRECKELIRHRVFITKLIGAQEEEYKARHDALVEKRGDKITEGPTSNFSIWNAGGYIFGYCEFDTTMEEEYTEEIREIEREWESKMLEIMEWRTNDVDWLTGIYHENIKRIAWHG